MNTDKKLSSHVASVLRANRADRRLSQSELAKKSGLSQPTISRIESDSRTLKVDELAMVCDGLGVRLEDVLEEAKRLSRSNDEAARIIRN